MKNTYQDPRGNRTVLLAKGAAVTAVIAALLLANVRLEEVREEFHSAAPAAGIASQRVFDDATMMQANVATAHTLSTNLTVDVTDPDQPAAPPGTWTLNMDLFPDLVASSREWIARGFAVDVLLLNDYLTRGIMSPETTAKSVKITSVESKKNYKRAVTDGIARDGYAYGGDVTPFLIVDALERGQQSVRIEAPYKEGSALYTDESGKTFTLELLGTGYSNFSNSPPDRLWNIHKAVNDHVHNVFIPMGETFSFNTVIEPPVTLKKGWREGLGLFGGGTAFTPGAGICQVATTVFRAALIAGLPINKKRNHSLWVDHYETYGVGLDATIFPGVQDLIFKNNTQGPILIQSYTVGDDLLVKMYGVRDGRTVTLEGPYFNTTKNKPVGLRGLIYSQIGWVRTVSGEEGVSLQETIVSKYSKGYPRVLRTKYEGLPGMALLHPHDSPVVVAGEASLVTQ